jgi:hypothetical protein
MLFEHAVEPQAITADWPTCRYLSEKFGFDRARLLSLYPAKWLPLSIDAASGLRDVEKKTVVERLLSLKRNASIRSGRSYDPTVKDWLGNAVAQQAIIPFHAILARQNPEARDFVLTTDDISETHPMMVAPHDVQVERDAPTLASRTAWLQAMWT